MTSSVKKPPASMQRVDQHGLWALGSGVAWLIISYVGFEPGMTVLLVATLLYIRVRELNH